MVPYVLVVSVKVADVTVTKLLLTVPVAAKVVEFDNIFVFGAKADESEVLVEVLVDDFVLSLVLVNCEAEAEFD
ncbi:hypothetical protein P7G31_08805 [Streptococcus parauberis]|uniref:Uncharacterized protein n=1 Tax=Streptococcus parauberis TaxID=1348 RepID=A0A854WSW1_9STRE|nr:hypothetical protein [Streptococcus parauberis]MDT2732323.1 hypothetical protein [Streptococcus parauberis]PCH14213.1 hypothetical protein A9Y57_00111 [Streptococcus parauberis]